MMMVKRTVSLHGGVVKLPYALWWVYEEEEADNDDEDGDEYDKDAKYAVLSS